jgi:3-oxoacyl-[acyl-carrier protein] reductase
MKIDLTGQTALITGATGGIGGAIAKTLHSLGAHVVISGTNHEKLDHLGSILGSNYTKTPCNLSDISSCIDLVSSIDKLDIMVCNAGITKDMLSIKMSDEDFAEVININLMSSFALNREAIKKMMRVKYGRIINISSIVGFTGNAGQANYAASKAGLVGMTKSLALEVASRNITINCVAPGFIESAMTDKLSDTQKEAVFNKIPMKKFGTVEDVAHGVAFLSSSFSSYITGQTIHINGGMAMF